VRGNGDNGNGIVLETLVSDSTFAGGADDDARDAGGIRGIRHCVFGAALIVEALVAPSAMLYLLVRRFAIHECTWDVVYVGSLPPLTAIFVWVHSSDGEASDMGLWFLVFYLLAAVTAYVAMRWSLRSRLAD
jgi:hypothetical protein